MTEPLRLMIYDDTCRGRPMRPGLTHSWMAGALLYRGLGRLDRWRGVRNWEEALRWLATVEPARPIAEIQFWGHGKWGRANIDGQPLDIHALRPGHPLHEPLRVVRDRLTGPDALWWFRTCETFGCQPGHQFASAWTDFHGCRAAGHTFIIGPWQSGLHTLMPGQEPDWDPTEGLLEGSIEAPQRALWSGPRQPNTITCLHGAVPAGF